jgi:hypothetical protein
VTRGSRWILLATTSALACGGSADLPETPTASATARPTPAARTWSPAAALEASFTQPYRTISGSRFDYLPLQPRVAWISDTAANVAWSDFYVGIWSATYMKASGWARPDYVVRPPRPSAIENCGFCTTVEPTVALARQGDGEEVAAWHEAGGTVPGVWSSGFRLGSGWGPSSHIADTAPGSRRGLDVRAAGASNVTVWGLTADTDTVWVAHTRGRQAGVDRLDETPERFGFSAPAADVDAAGNIAVVWGRRDAGLQARWLPADSESWGPRQELAATAVRITDSCPAVALDGLGGAVVGYVRGGTTSTVMLARLDPQRGWSSEEALGSDDHCPAVARTTPGTVLIAWSDARGVWVRSVPGTGTPQSLSTEPAINVRIAASPSGDAVVAWLRPAGYESGTVWASRRVRGTWSAAEALQTAASQAAALATRVDVDINPRGDALAVWFETTQRPDGVRPVDARLTPWSAVAVAQ